MPLPRNDPIHACLFAYNSFPIFVQTPPFYETKKHATTPSISDTCLLAPLSFSFTVYYIFCFLHVLFSLIICNFSFICLHNHLHLSISSIQHRNPSTPCVAQVPPVFPFQHLSHSSQTHSIPILTNHGLCYISYLIRIILYPGCTSNIYSSFFMYLVRFLLSLCLARTTTINDTTHRRLRVLISPESTSNFPPQSP